MEAVKVMSLKKQYGNQVVLNDIEFSVMKGEIFGLIGVNGAGKTTTLECIEGLRKADQGSIAFSGTLGVQLQSSSLPSQIKVKEALQLFSVWNGRSFRPDSVTVFGMDGLLERKYQHLSIGQKRRLHLALALLSDPDILILDEPTAGLDIDGRIEIHQIIKNLKKQGKTVILSSHDLMEIEDLCDRVAILSNGRLVLLSESRDFADKNNRQVKVRAKFSEPISLSETEESVYDSMSDSVIIATDHLEDAMITLLEMAKQHHVRLTDFIIERDGVEQMFLDIIRKEKSS